MVKPQAKLRSSARPDDPNLPFEDEGLSLDSTGVLVLSTNESSYFEPDFMIVQVDEDQNRNVPLVRIDVKKGVVSVQAAGAQLGNYIDVLVTKKPHKAFVGILVPGGAFYCYNSAKRRAPTPGRLAGVGRFTGYF